MISRQLSVFIENRQGRLGEVLGVLKNNNVNILSLSLADTTEFGLLRLIVSNPALTAEKLVKEGFSAMLTDILVVSIEHKSGSLQGALNALSDSGINVEYMYGLSVHGEKATVVLKASDLKKADEILAENGYSTLSAEEIVEF